MFNYKHMFKTQFIWPFIYLFLVIAMYMVQVNFPEIETTLALYPRHFKYILGVVTTVFLHANVSHLSSNVLPLAACLFGLFYFYKTIAKQVLFISHLLSGFLIWLLARPSFHIGASGLVYALVFFILISALVRKNKQLMVVAFIILVFQNGLIWGVFPQDNQVSWESHLLGAVVGIVLAVLYRNKGPQNDSEKHWNEDDKQEDEYKALLDGRD
jgi:membrane associated rhomboid family serine protease